MEAIVGRYVDCRGGLGEGGGGGMNVGNRLAVGRDECWNLVVRSGR